MKHLYIYIILGCTILTSCKKGWLDAKPNNSAVVPTKVQDFQALLDNTTIMNQGQTGDLGEIGAADFQTTYSSYLTFEARYRNAYVWSSADDFYEGNDPEWFYSYTEILYANVT